MTGRIQVPKVCPSCCEFKSLDEMKMIASRSAGKVRHSWRCFTCIKKKADAIKAAKVRLY